MDELTFISGCVLAGLITREGVNVTMTEHVTELAEEAQRVAELALPILSSRGHDAIDVGELFDRKPSPPAEGQQRDREERLREAVEVSERDALSELSSIIEAVDVAGGWPTPEAKADADVVAWVRDVAVERDRLKQLYHNKCIDAAQDAAENEVLKSRNAALRAQQVRLLSALERARELALLVNGMAGQGLVPRNWAPSREAAELIELIDLLKLECKPDEEPHG